MAAWYGLKVTNILYQSIIKNMPPHDIYIECFFGGGAILKRKP